MKAKLQAETILVFKTSVKYKRDIIKIKKALGDIKDLQISFDLDDCDKVMRTESNYCNPEVIIERMANLGFHCEELE